MTGKASGPRATDDEQADRWLAILRQGTPAEKATARRALSAIFAARGLTAEAIDLLVTNAREGQRDAELFRTLAHLYRQAGDEYLAASAALEATRLTGPRTSADPAVVETARSAARPDIAQSLVDGSGRPGASPVPEATSSEHRGQTPRSTSRTSSESQAGHDAPWRRPVWIAGWVVAGGTALAALGVAPSSPGSTALYALSAASLSLLLAGSGAARNLVRVPTGPLGDGLLLFVWLLTLLAGGALLPRDTPFVMAPTSQSGIATPTVERFGPPTGTAPSPTVRDPLETPEASPSPSPQALTGRLLR
jgi:hypothetical protein